MPKFSAFVTLLDETTFDGSVCLFSGYDSSDATSTSNWRITGNDFLLWIQSELLYATPIPNLIDSTGGTPSVADTLVATTDTSASDQSAPVNNNFATLLTMINAINTALEGAGIISKT